MLNTEMDNSGIRFSAKRVKPSPRIALVAITSVWLSCATVAGLAQDQRPFTLFEPIESPDAVNNPSASRVTRSDAPAGSSGVPAFTLVGTSRIGEQRAAIVRHSSGVTVPVKLRGTGVTPIPGYESYAIVGAAGNALSVRYPGGQYCVPFESSGVRCSEEDGVALLSLTTAAPIEPERPPAEPESGSTDDGNPVAADESRNPFALLRERARNGELQTGDPDTTSQRFQPRRIDPNDVPPGKRIVSTPFGDRLVDI